ncbi:Floral homeotic protein [Ranunculus cassubicifolius]
MYLAKCQLRTKGNMNKARTRAMKEAEKLRPGQGEDFMHLFHPWKKKVYELYQKVAEVDLWDTEYERMQKELKEHKHTNMKLRKEIGKRIGECLDDLSFDELRGLEQDLDESVKTVRDRKYHTLTTQTETYRKKCSMQIRNLQETHTHLARECEARGEDPYYEDYEALMAMTNGGAHFMSYGLQPGQPDHQDGDGY